MGSIPEVKGPGYEIGHSAPLVMRLRTTGAIYLRLHGLEGPGGGIYLLTSTVIFILHAACCDSFASDVILLNAC